MRNGLFFALAFAACGFLVVHAISDTMWSAVGFAITGGLMLVLFPRKAAGDPDAEPAQYAWVIPDKEPARTIVTLLLGLMLVGAGLVVVLR